MVDTKSPNNMENSEVEKKSLPEKISFKGQLGGARPNSGRKPGKLGKEKLERLAMLESIKQRIMKSTNKILNAQMSLAEGISYLYVVRTNKKGIKERPELITNQFIIESYLAGELDGDPDEYYYITTERPDNRAIDSMFDRAYGKVPNTIEGNGPDGEIVIKQVIYGNRDNPTV